MPPKKHPTNSTEKTFSWTDEEVALLMRILIDYKASKSEKGLDEPKGKGKNQNKTAIMIEPRLYEKYPRNESESKLMRITCVYTGKSRSDPIRKWSDTKRVRFRSRIKIDADSGAEVYRITSSSCKREADPQHFLYRIKSDPLPCKRGLNKGV